MADETPSTVETPSAGPATPEQEAQAREEAQAASEKAQEAGPPKTQAQIDAERTENQEDVPEGEQGRPTDAREWTALDNERQLKIARAQFEAQFAAQQSAGK